ncbi:MAG: RraA family protein [Sphingobium sp.]|nr:RraA family protein [Sphingobium sp.]MBP8671789.1 RraA family protein [Sphingobium sp.]MBP9158049.1 RraA family protein [Sphingobium sp.]MCC6480929.1 RraA family protein [Sphingomonadaceae bacterium]
MTDTKDEYVVRLARIDCCALSDALDRLKLGGQATGFPQMSGSGRIAGRAVTVRLGTGDPPPGPPRHLGTTAIEAANPGDIIVVEQRAGVEAGCWGGLLTVGAMQRGVAGVIADGPVRDIDEARSYGFPIYTNKITSLTARGRVVEKETNGPVQIGSVTVNAGDYVVADNSASIFIAPGNVEAVLRTAEEIIERETAMAAAIRAGVPISQVMGGNYEHMLEGSK